MNKVLIILAAIVLTNCAKDAHRTVQWFKDHETERKAVIADCNRNAVPESVDCVNAQKAEDALSLSRRGYVKPKPVTFD